MKSLPLDSIRIDGGTQTREAIDQATVDAYAEAMGEGAKFPAMIVFFDGAAYWLADGFHRYHAARQVGFKEAPADVREGTQWDAVLFACGANSEPRALPRNNKDKRKSVWILLDSGKCLTWSDNQIAKQCAVSHTLVGTVRAEWLSCNGCKMPESQTVTRNGKTYEQKRKHSEPREDREEREPAEVSMPAEPEEPRKEKHREVGPTCNGMQFARMAIMDLEQIEDDDAERREAFDYVENWIKGHRQ